MALSKEDIDDIRDQIKQQLLEELKDEQTKAREALVQKKEQERKARDLYVERMLESPEPWVEIIGMVDTEKGTRVELEWNSAFVEYLRKEGVTGTHEDQIVQKWMILLMKNLSDDIEDNMNPTKSTEFA